MHTKGMSFKAIGRQMGYHYTVVSGLVRKYKQTNNVKDLLRSGRPRVTSDRDDRALQRLVSKFQSRRAKHHAKRVRRCLYANSGRLLTLLDLSSADFRRLLTVLVDRRLLGSQCCLSTGLVANGIRLTKRCNALSSRSDVTRGLPDLSKSFTLLVCLYFLRRMPFATSPVLKQHWLPNRRLSTRTVNNRLKSAGLKSRRVNKRPLLAYRHRRTRLAWCLARRDWNLRTWRNINWSDESRFLFHVTDDRMRVWRHKNTAYTPRNI
jgi:hypothetical protein